jgi:hypothetical protein
MGDGTVEQLSRPGVGGEKVPAGLAFEALDAFDASFAAGARSVIDCKASRTWKP